jgi:two-component system chemotaxis response regulator CheB
MFATDGMPIEGNCIYVPLPDHHMVLEEGRIRLNQSAKIHHTRPAADPLFLSAASSFGSRVMGIILSGGDGDGASGLRAIKAHGGIALVQCPAEALKPAMPRSALATDSPEALPIEQIAARVREFCLADQSFRE